MRTTTSGETTRGRTGAGTEVPRPARPAGKDGPCALCERTGKRSTFHHLIPRHCHRKPRFRRRFSVAEMRTKGLWLCPECHAGIHALIPDEKVLGWEYASREALLGHPGIARHVDWARKQK